MALTGGKIVDITVQRDAERRIVALDVDIEIGDDRAIDPWRGRYSFTGDQLAELLDRPLAARRVLLRTRVMRYAREMYRVWSQSLPTSAEPTPPEKQNVDDIPPFSAAEIGGPEPAELKKLRTADEKRARETAGPEPESADAETTTRKE